jgi:hypothetical protein
LPRQEIDTGMESLQRVATIARNWLTEIELEEADIVVRPKVGQRAWSDMTNLSSIVESGRDAMTKAMPELQEALATQH